MSNLQSIPKDKLALSQLNMALRLYFNEEEYPSAITLAAASEEIFGKLAENKGKTHSLSRQTTELYDFYRTVTEPTLDLVSDDPKTNNANEDKIKKMSRDLKNKAKNNFKHHDSETDKNYLKLDLELETAMLLTRALENFELYYDQAHPEKQDFIKKKIANNRIKSQGDSFTWIEPNNL